MLSHIYLPFALGLNIVKYVLNNIYVCPFPVTKLIQKSQPENLTLHAGGSDFSFYDGSDLKTFIDKMVGA